MVPPAGPGIFTVKPSGPGAFKLVVTGHTLTSRGDIEKYLAYRAARHTIEQGGEWFTLNEDRGKGETAVPVPITCKGPSGVSGPTAIATFTWYVPISIPVYTRRNILLLYLFIRGLQPCLLGIGTGSYLPKRFRAFSSSASISSLWSWPLR